MTQTLAEMGEAGLLALLRRQFGRPSNKIPIAVGDDAAAIRWDNSCVVTCNDMLVENVDFKFDWSTWADVGHKACGVNLSDLAAMGAEPAGLLLSLALPAHHRVGDVMSLVRGCAALGRRFGAPLIGGDLSSTEGPVVVSVTALGRGRAASLMQRHRGRPGDLILVSGTLGEAGAGLLGLQKGVAVGDALLRRQRRPTPQVSLGLALARSGKVRSTVDISDGLVRDALHLPQSGCTVEIDAGALPIAPKLLRAAERLGEDPLALALGGGEDFELAAAVAPENVAKVQAVSRETGKKLTIVGKIVRGRCPRWLRIAESRFSGFEHFR